MTLLGEILLEHYAGSTSSADQAVVAAVEELEKHADQHPQLVARVELAMMRAGNVGIPIRHVDEVRELMNELEAA